MAVQIGSGQPSGHLRSIFAVQNSQNDVVTRSDECPSRQEAQGKQPAKPGDNAEQQDDEQNRPNAQLWAARG